MNFSLVPLVNYAKGFQCFYTFYGLKKEEDVIKQGRNYLLALAMQIPQVTFAITQVDTLLREDIYKGPYPFLAGHIFSLTANAAILGVSFAGGMHAAFQAEMRRIEWVNRRWKTENPKKLVVFLNRRKVKINAFICKHAGNLTQVVVIATALARFILGHRQEASMTLISMGVCLLDQYDYLSVKASLVFNEKLILLSQISTIVLGGTLQKLIAGIFLIKSVVPSILFFANQLAIKKSQQIEKEKLDKASAEKRSIIAKWTAKEIMQFSPDTPLKIDLTHFTTKINLAEDVTNIELQELNELFEKVDWMTKENFLALDKKITEDDCWWEDRKNWSEELVVLENDYSQHLVTGNKNPEILKAFHSWKIKWTKQQLECFINNLTGKRKPKGDLNDLDGIIRHVKIIIKHLKEIALQLDALTSHPDPTQEMLNKQDRLSKQFQNLILMLAIDGGDYCISELDRAARQALNTLILDAELGVSPLQGRIYLCLQEQRSRLFQIFYMTVNGFMLKYNVFFQFRDLLVYNNIWKYYGSAVGINLKLPVVEAKQKLTALTSHELKQARLFQKIAVIAKIVLAYVKLKLCELHFNFYRKLYSYHAVCQKGYNEDFILNEVKGLFGPCIKPQEYVDWWENYIQTLPNISPEEISDLRRELTDPVSGAIVMQKEKQIFKKKWLKIFLVEIGVLSKPQKLNVF